MNLNKLNRTLHLWLGLTSGLLVFFISISGCMYAFKDEIFNLAHKDYLYINSPAKETIALDSLMHIAQNTLGNNHEISYVNTYSDETKTWEFKAYKYNPEAISYFKWCEYDFIVYINPYTGEILKVLNHKYEFFHLVKMFHWSFWLNTKYGQPIVGWSVLVFAVCLITGMVLWWPFNRKSKKRSFLIKKTKKWPTLNYDLHNVLGFYSIPVTLILSLTGMVWAFKWFMALVYAAANLSTVPPERSTIESSTLVTQIPNIYEHIYQISNKTHTDAYLIQISTKNDGARSTIGTYIKLTKPVYYKAFMEEHDRYTGELLHSKGFDDLSRGEKLIAMNYDIHIGAILGLPGKFIVFFAALIAGSLPITGFYIWWNKKRQKKKLFLHL